MEKTTERQKFGIRDIMTIAAMMVITFLVAMIIGSFTLPFPMLSSARSFIWSRRTASTSMAFCLRGPQSMA